MLKHHLAATYLQCWDVPETREQVHNAATIAGIAFANVFLGVCPSATPASCATWGLGPSTTTHAR